MQYVFNITSNSIFSMGNLMGISNSNKSTTGLLGWEKTDFLFGIRIAKNIYITETWPLKS